MKPIRDCLAQSKEKAKNRALVQLRSEFKVVESGGMLWLMHNDVAFAKIGPYASANEIATLLNNARNVAVEFEQLQKTDTI